MLAYGGVHGAFIAVAVAAQIAVDLDLPAQALSDLAVTSNGAIRQLVYPVFGLFSVLFVVAVWTRQTAYPRWLALCSPATFFRRARAAVQSPARKLTIGGRRWLFELDNRGLFYLGNRCSLDSSGVNIDVARGLGMAG